MNPALLLCTEALKALMGQSRIRLSATSLHYPPTSRVILSLKKEQRGSITTPTQRTEKQTDWGGGVLPCQLPVWKIVTFTGKEADERCAHARPCVVMTHWWWLRPLFFFGRCLRSRDNSITSCTYCKLSRSTVLCVSILQKACATVDTDVASF